MLRACLEFKPDVIYLNQSGSYKVALVAAAILKLPIVAHIRIFEDASYLGRLSNASLSRLRAIIAISAAVKAEVERFETLKKVPLYQIYDSYARANKDVLPSPVADRIASRIACVGRLVPAKGQDVLIHALHALAKTGHTVECLMVGEGEERFVGTLKQLACEYGLEFEDTMAGLCWGCHSASANMLNSGVPLSP